MLTIGILITANSASAAPQGTVIKEGVLTYPAGPYLSGDPLLLSLVNYTGDNDTQRSAEEFEIAYLENEYLFFDNNSQNVTSRNLTVWNLGVYPSSFFDNRYKSNAKVVNAVFNFLFYPITSLNRTSIQLIQCYFSVAAHFY